MYTRSLPITALLLLSSSAAALKLAVGGAMDPTHNHHPEQITHHTDGGDASAVPVTVYVHNLWGAPMQAVVVNAAGSPSWGGPGYIAEGATAAYALPAHGNGQITIGHTTDPRGSKIELNNGFNTAATQLYLDVSYVDGFSVPITCACGGQQTGCSKPLFHQPGNSCVQRMPGPLCVNPAPDNGPPLPFFAACRNNAYVISNQNGAGTGYFCASNVVHCCIGVACSSGNSKRDLDLDRSHFMAARRGLMAA